MLCRVILNDGATTVVQIRPSETIRELVNRLLDKRGLNYSAYEVFLSDQTKPVNTSDLSSILSGCEVKIEQRVVFKLDLPNRKVISVKSKVTKILVDVLRPILHKYGFGLDTVRVSIGTEEYVDVNLLVTSVDGCRLNIQLVDGKLQFFLRFIGFLVMDPVFNMDHLIISRNIARSLAVLDENCCLHPLRPMKILSILYKRYRGNTVYYSFRFLNFLFAIFIINFPRVHSRKKIK